MNWVWLMAGYVWNVLGRANRAAKSQSNALTSRWALLWRWRKAIAIRGFGVGAAFLFLQHAPGMLGTLLGMPNLSVPEKLFHPVTLVPMGFFFDAILDRWLEKHPDLKAEVPRIGNGTIAIPPYKEPKTK